MSAASTPYHHGDLPNALRCAAVEVIEERGLGAFSLREVARRAGVSHTAPAHHFGDMKGLLTSVAAEGFDALHEALTNAGAGIDAPDERLRAIGLAYVELARSNHGHVEVMFRTDIVDENDEALQVAGINAYSVLEDTVNALIEREGLTVDPTDAVWMCWSTMQGLVALGPKLQMIAGTNDWPAPSDSDLVDRFTRLILAGLRSA